MSPAREAQGDLARLLAETEDDLAAARMRTNELARLRASTEPFAEGSPHLAVAALALHHYYTAIESCLLRMVQVFEGKPPQSADWHRDLLRIATLAIPGIRPPILGRASEKCLASVMKFRHFLRHAYAVDLDASRLALLVDATLACDPAVQGDLVVFREHVQQCIDALGTDEA